MSDENKDEKFIVTPWEVKGKIDYDKLIQQFGTQAIDDALLRRISGIAVKGKIDYDKLIQQFGTQAIDSALLRRISAIAGELHPLLRRKVFFSQRDLKWILDRYEAKEHFALYTGRGPSGHTHLGHMMPWIFTKWIQDKFDAPLYFQMTDDEKFMFKDSLSLQEAQHFAYENALDVIALGFDPKKTQILIDTKHISKLYPIAIQVAKRVTFSTAKAVFGFDNSTNIGSIFFTSMQAAPAFLPSVEAGKNVPCLIPCAIDQDPHFRVARDVAPLLGYYKPALIHCKMLPSLAGGDKMSASAIPCAIDQDPHFRVARDVAPLLGYYKPALIHCKMLPSLAGGDKMSASAPQTSIFTTDAPKAAKKKVMGAFTGGGATVEEQRKSGANPDVCSVFSYYYYLFEYDDAKLAEIEQRCRSGAMLCGECKMALAEKVEKFLAAHQEKREVARDRINDFIKD